MSPSRNRGETAAKVFFLLSLILGLFAYSALAQGTAKKAESDCGKASGGEIQAYRDAYVPQTFSPEGSYWFTVDVIVLAVALLSGTWLVARHKPARWITLHLSVAFLYFGVFRGGCLCPVGATGNVSYALIEPERIGRAELALFMLPLLAALLWGRVFCGTVCPLGAIQQIASPLKASPLPPKVHRFLLILPLVVLSLTVVGALLGRCSFVCEIDPYTPIFFQGYLIVQKLSSLVTAQFAEHGFLLACGATAWLMLAGALIIGWIIPRVFCRYLCPYGVLLGVISLVALRKRQIDADACEGCKKCMQQCPVQAIRIDRAAKISSLSNYQCVQCGRCSNICRFKAIKRGA